MSSNITGVSSSPVVSDLRPSKPSFVGRTKWQFILYYNFLHVPELIDSSMCWDVCVCGFFWGEEGVEIKVLCFGKVSFNCKTVWEDFKTGKIKNPFSFRWLQYIGNFRSSILPGCCDFDLGHPRRLKPAVFIYFDHTGCAAGLSVIFLFQQMAKTSNSHLLPTRKPLCCHKGWYSLFFEMKWVKAWGRGEWSC